MELAHLHYEEMLERDDKRRDISVEQSRITAARWNRVFGDGYRAALTRVASGEAPNDEIDAMVGVSLEVFRDRGAIDAPHGSFEWRALARLIASVEIEAQTRSFERDTGFYGGTPTFPALTQPRPSDLFVQAVPLKSLFTQYIAELQRSSRGAEAARRWKPCIEALTKFVKHDNSARLTRQDVMNWRDDLLTTLAPKTVRDAYMSGVKAESSNEE